MKREDTMSYCCVTSYSSDLLIMLASLPVTKSMPGRVKWPAVACISILVVDHTRGAANSLRCCWHQPSHPWRCHMGRPSLCWSRANGAIPGAQEQYRARLVVTIDFHCCELVRLAQTSLRLRGSLHHVVLPMSWGHVLAIMQILTGTLQLRSSVMFCKESLQGSRCDL